MTTNYTTEYVAGLIHELCKLPQETEWVEFKVNTPIRRRLANISRLCRILQHALKDEPLMRSFPRLSD